MNRPAPRSRCRPGFALALLLSLSFTVLWTARARFWPWLEVEGNIDSPVELALGALPQQVRRLGADVLWLRADEYMHFGPSRRYRGAFLAGSYAANTEILPLLELAIRLDPTHFDAYGILGQNLALYLDRFVPALRTLQQGILANRHHPRVHELYGTIAYCYGFRKSYSVKQDNDRVVAMRYLDAALDAFFRNGQPVSEAREVLNPTTYQVLRARFLVEQGRREEALAAWWTARLPLGPEGGLLGEYLRRVAAGEPVPALPEDLRPETAAPVSSQTLAIEPTVADPLAGFPWGPPSDARVPGGSSGFPAGEGTHGGHPGVAPEDRLASSPAHDHAPGEACDHEGGVCHHEKAPPPLLDRAKAWSGVFVQMALLGLAGLALLVRSRR